MPAPLPELRTARLDVRLARPGMQAAMARFLARTSKATSTAGRRRRRPHSSRNPSGGSAWASPSRNSTCGRAARFVLQQGPERRTHPRNLQLHEHRARPVPRAATSATRSRVAHEGQGLMAEALRATNAFMFDSLHLHRIMANYRPENARSARLLERLGFVKEGRRARLSLHRRRVARPRAHVAHQPELDPAGIEPAGR